MKDWRVASRCSPDARGRAWAVAGVAAPRTSRVGVRFPRIPLNMQLGLWRTILRDAALWALRIGRRMGELGEGGRCESGSHTPETQLPSASNGRDRAVDDLRSHCLEIVILIIAVDLDLKMKQFDITSPLVQGNS